MGRLTENSRAQHQEQVALGHRRGRRPDGGPNGVIVAQGGAFGGWSLYSTNGAPKYCYNLFGLEAIQDRGDRDGPGRRRTRCAWSSLTTAAAWPRAAPSRSTSTVSKREGSRRATPANGLLGRRDDGRRPGHGIAVSRDYSADESIIHGTVNWVQIDIDAAAEDLDHLITPEERFRIAMAGSRSSWFTSDA